MDANNLHDRAMIKTDIHDADIGEYFYTLEPLPDYKFTKKQQFVFYKPCGDGDFKRFRVGKCKRKTVYACTIEYMKKPDITEDIMIALGINEIKAEPKSEINWDEI